MSEGAFYNCAKLTEIIVAESNANYSSEDGVLFNKAKTELICYPAAKTGSVYTVPEDVISIEPSAFGFAKHLTSVSLPSNITSIGAYAFRGSAVKSIVLNGNVLPSIGGSAFADSALIAIYMPSTYTGYDRTCDIGGKTLRVIKTTLEKLELTLIDGTYYMAAHDNYGITGEVVIPPIYDGKPVTVIDSGFGNCNAVTSLTIPHTVDTINGYTLHGDELEEIAVIDADLPSFDDDAYEWTKGKLIVVVPAGYTGQTGEIEYGNFFKPKTIQVVRYSD